MFKKFLLNLVPISALSRQVRKARLTYLSPLKLYRLEGAMRGVTRDKVPGCFAEFGIALGGSGVVIARTARSENRAFHGFDVFGMIPPPSTERDDEKSNERYEIIAKGGSVGIGGDTYYGYIDNLYDQVCETFAKYDVPCREGAVMLHKGLFDQTLPQVDLGPVAFAHIDCDWYDPVLYCLETLDPFVSKGGKIILDDYNDYGGCRQATDAFLDAHPNYRLDNGKNAILTKG